MDLLKLESEIEKIPDYPKPGILFYDISPLLSNQEAFQFAISEMANLVAHYKINKIAAIDARGFIFGSALAIKMNLGLTLIRKKNKLPGKLISKKYQLEYGENCLEINPSYSNSNFALIDDLLATGGTSKASCDLIKQAGGTVSCFCTLIELCFLNGRKEIDVPFETLIKY